MSRKRERIEKEFVLEIGGQPILVLMSRDLAEARRFCAQPWLMEELASYRSFGRPVLDEAAAVSIRNADAHEAAELQTALSLELAREEYEGYVFAFLIEIDAPPQ